MIQMVTKIFIQLKQGWCVRFAGFICLLIAGSAESGQVRIESETLTSLRSNADFQMESPFYEFLSGNYEDDDDRLSLNADFSVYREMVTGEDDFTIHLLNGSYVLIPETFKLKAGRSFESQNAIRAHVMDRLAAELELWNRQFELGAFVGKEQRLELHRSGLSAQVYGSYAQFTTAGENPWVMRAKLQRRNYESADASDEVVTEATLRKTIPAAFHTTLLASSELNIDTGNLNRAEGGADVRFSKSKLFRLRAGTYNLEPQFGAEQPIFTLFSQGSLNELSGQYEVLWGERWVTSFLLGADQYVVQSPDLTYGYRSEAEAKYFTRIFSADFSLYQMDSFGGSIYGARTGAHYQFTDRSKIYLGLDYAHYEKITSSSRGAVNSILGIGHQFTPSLKGDLAAELNSNNNLIYDLRGFFRLTYFLWTET